MGGRGMVRIGRRALGGGPFSALRWSRPWRPRVAEAATRRGRAHPRLLRPSLPAAGRACRAAGRDHRGAGRDHRGAAETGEALPPSRSVTDYAAYVGGSGPADTSLTPIKIGYINQEGGPIEIGKTADNGVEIGTTFINEQAGGIGGHPVEIVTCFIAQAEEEGSSAASSSRTTRDRRDRDRSRGHRERVAARSARELEAGRRGRVGERVRHQVAEHRDPLRRLAVHPGAVRDVRARHAGSYVGRAVYPEGAGLDAAAAGRPPRSRQPGSRSRWCPFRPIRPT